MNKLCLVASVAILTMAGCSESLQIHAIPDTNPPLNWIWESRGNVSFTELRHPRFGVCHLRSASSSTPLANSTESKRFDWSEFYRTLNRWTMEDFLAYGLSAQDLECVKKFLVSCARCLEVLQSNASALDREPLCAVAGKQATEAFSSSYASRYGMCGAVELREYSCGIGKTDPPALVALRFHRHRLEEELWNAAPSCLNEVADRFAYLYKDRDGILYSVKRSVFFASQLESYF